MLTTLRIPASQLADLERALNLGKEPIRRVCEHLNGLNPLPLTVGELQKAIEGAVGTNEEDANALVGLLLTWNQLARQRDMPIDSIVESLRGAIAAIPKSGVALQTAWIAIEPELKELIRAAPIRSVAKAIDLSYDHANLFQGARIIADIRPIFNDSDGDQMAIDGAVVTYTLRLHYDNREGEHNLSMALDEVDIRALQHQCDRAIKKAEFSKSAMMDTGTPTIIAGDAQ